MMSSEKMCSTEPTASAPHLSHTHRRLSRESANEPSVDEVDVLGATDTVIRVERKKNLSRRRARTVTVKDVFVDALGRSVDEDPLADRMRFVEMTQ